MSKKVYVGEGITVEVNLRDDEVKRAFLNAIDRGLISIGKRAEDYAADDTPVDTGNLKNSITSEVEGTAVWVGTDVTYGKWIEYGHHSYAGRYMLKNAATQHRDEYRQLLIDSLKNA